MKVILITAQKGGVGKSTIAAHLAVEFTRQGRTVAALDLDRQGSLTRWAKQRGDDMPTVLPVPYGSFRHYREAAERDGVDVLIVDTPPHAGQSLGVLSNSVDLGIVPLRPGFFDLFALAETVKLLGSLPSLVLLNQVPVRGNEAKVVRELLAAQMPNLRIADQHLSLRKAYSSALIAGKSVTEMERPSAKAHIEFCQLFTEISGALQ